MEVKRQIVAAWKRILRTYRGTNGLNWITVHETANTSTGADAQAHANLQSKLNPRKGSWHETVDDHEAIQSFPDTARCWHSGKGRDNGNINSYAFEICVNRDGDFEQAVRNAAACVRAKMDQHNIPLSRVVQHNHWSGKNCPTNLRNGSKGIDWDDFLEMVAGATEVSKPTPLPPQPSKPGALKVDGYWGSSTTRRLQDVLGTTTDGEVSSQPKIWRAQNPGLTSGWNWVSSSNGSRVIVAMQDELDEVMDGKIGPSTIAALQRRYATVADGELWAKSPAIKAMQAALNRNTF